VPKLLTLARFAPSIASILAAVGLQVSDWHNNIVAVLLLAAAGVFLFVPRIRQAIHGNPPVTSDSNTDHKLTPEAAVEPRIVFGEPSIRPTSFRVVIQNHLAHVSMESLTIPVMNDPITRADSATAMKLHPMLAFFTPTGLVEIADYAGRWANQEDPPNRLPNGEVDLPANARPGTLDIAVNVGGKLFGFNSELHRRPTTDWPFLGTTLRPGDHLVRIQIRGIGVELVEQWLSVASNPFRANKCDPPVWREQLGAARAQQ
jgi:hypothetical protein